MAPAPPWVKALKPAAPQGSELLTRERDSSNLDVNRLSEFLFTKELLDRKAKILQALQAEQVFDKTQNYFDGRVDRFKTALARSKRLQQLTVKHGWSRDDTIMAMDLMSEPGPYGLHMSMFLVNDLFP